MGKLTLGSALCVLAITGTATADAPADWIVLKISRVQVEPKKADDTPWDLQKAEEPNGCRIVGVGATAVLGVAGGAVATFLCMQSGSKQRERDPRAPDLFVQVGVGDTKFRTPVASNTFSEAFDFPIVVPLDAVSASGIDIRVHDMDQDVNAGELIGMVRLTKQQIQTALSSNTPVLSLSDDRVKRLELEVVPYDPPRDSQPFRFAVNQHPTATPTRARAGELVTISAQGTYGVRSNAEQVDPNGYGNAAKSSYNRKPDFEGVNHAGAIAYVGAPTEMHAALFVGSCVSAVTPVPGLVYFGVNDTDVGNNTGSIDFTTRISLPTVDQWRTGGGASCAKATEPGGSATSSKESTLTPDIVLSKIQSAYMAGVKRCYKLYLSKAPEAKGKVTLSLSVNETGRTTNGSAKGFVSEIDDCITGLMGSWRFPVPKDKDGDPVEASFAITLRLEP